MVVPENLSFGLKSCDSDYAHIWYLGYDIRSIEVENPQVTNRGHIIEIWTHPFIFHGYIYTDMEYEKLLGIEGHFRNQSTPMRIFLEENELPERYSRIESVFRRVMRYYWLIYRKRKDEERLK